MKYSGKLKIFRKRFILPINFTIIRSHFSKFLWRFAKICPPSQTDEKINALLILAGFFLTFKVCKIGSRG